MLISQADKRSLDKLLLQNLLFFNQNQLRGKHAKTVCDLMKRCFHRVVTVKAVKWARQHIYDQRKSARELERLIEAMGARLQAKAQAKAEDSRRQPALDQISQAPPVRVETS